MKRIFIILLLLSENWIYSQGILGNTLSGRWQLSYGIYDKIAPVTPADLNMKNWPAIPATVPGNVELDLLEIR